MPNVKMAALDIERFGADGITVHPRHDARHIRHDDCFTLKENISTELNIEGNPTPEFIDLALAVRPAQATLVPDAEDAITSNAGGDTITPREKLTQITAQLQQAGIRVSIFVDPRPEMVIGAKACGADRVELYTEAYASDYSKNREQAIAPYVAAAKQATECGLGLNAGHDLSLENLAYFIEQIPQCDEVSIGHALICDALYYGLENCVSLYRREIERGQKAHNNR